MNLTLSPSTLTPPPFPLPNPLTPPHSHPIPPPLIVKYQVWNPTPSHPLWNVAALWSPCSACQHLPSPSLPLLVPPQWAVDVWVMSTLLSPAFVVWTVLWMSGQGTSTLSSKDEWIWIRVLCNGSVGWSRSLCGNLDQGGVQWICWVIQKLVWESGSGGCAMDLWADPEACVGICYGASGFISGSFYNSSLLFQDLWFLILQQCIGQRTWYEIIC